MHRLPFKCRPCFVSSHFCCRRYYWNAICAGFEIGFVIFVVVVDRIGETRAHYEINQLHEPNTTQREQRK